MNFKHSVLSVLSVLPILFIHSVVAMLMMSSVAFAQQEQGSDADGVDAVRRVGQLPYEVIVRPRVNRAHLRDLIQKVEQDFFDRFNELNPDDFYDIDCYRVKPTGTHLTGRICEPEFHTYFRSENASESMMLMISESPFMFLYSPRALKAELSPYYDRLTAMLEDHYSSDAELNAIGEALAELKDRLENYGREQ